MSIKKVVILTYLSILIISCSKDNSNNTVPNLDCNNSITINPVKFCFEHSENIVKASDFYANKAIQFTFKIENIQIKSNIVSKDTSIEIHVYDNNNNCSYYFDLDKNQREKIKQYSKGDSITMCGLYSQLYGWLFHFKHSIIIK